jgi:tRNA threonylcarbamoyladenosine biosynthesis protein TsaE
MDITASLDELQNIYDFLEKTLPHHAIIFLHGDLAAGKTTLTSYIAQKKGLGSASSPTFALQNSYDDRLFHYDLYRIDENQFMQMGLFEEFEKDGWHIIEWGTQELEKFLSNAGYDITTISIAPLNHQRHYTIKR